MLKRLLLANAELLKRNFMLLGTLEELQKENEDLAKPRTVTCPCCGFVHQSTEPEKEKARRRLAKRIDDWLGVRLFAD